MQAGFRTGGKGPPQRAEAGGRRFEVVDLGNRSLRGSVLEDLPGVGVAGDALREHPGRSSGGQLHADPAAADLDLRRQGRPFLRAPHRRRQGLLGP